MYSVGKGHVFKRTLQTDVEGLFTDDQQCTTSETLLCADSDYGTVWNVSELQAQLDLDHAAVTSRQANLPQMDPRNE